MAPAAMVMGSFTVNCCQAVRVPLSWRSRAHSVSVAAGGAHDELAVDDIAGVDVDLVPSALLRTVDHELAVLGQCLRVPELEFLKADMVGIGDSHQGGERDGRAGRLHRTEGCTESVGSRDAGAPTVNGIQPVSWPFACRSCAQSWSVPPKVPTSNALVGYIARRHIDLVPAALRRAVDHELAARRRADRSPQLQLLEAHAVGIGNARPGWRARCSCRASRRTAVCTDRVGSRAAGAVTVKLFQPLS